MKFLPPALSLPGGKRLVLDFGVFQGEPFALFKVALLEFDDYGNVILFGIRVTAISLELVILPR